ncbi:MAG: hypothetical protein V3R81_09065 [Gammaproteobacteria bacterium]
MRTAAAGRNINWYATLVLLMVLAAAISACAGGTLSSVFSGSGSNASSSNLAPVAFAPIIGPPPEIGNQLTAQLVTAAQQKSIPVVTDKSKSSTYTVRGYLAQSNENRAEKFSYILDVTDKSGKRVHRILGEEAVPAKPGAKPWTSINQTAMQKIAAKTANDLASWLPTQSGGAARTAAPAVTPTPQKPPPSSTPRRTASTRSTVTNVAVLVPPVSGAPGDGRLSLTNALRTRLRARGVHVSSVGGKNVYKVNGKVQMGPAPGGKQRVKIEWRLLNASGKDLGAVTQQSDVPKGSLDKTWGPAAISAGNAAASEILKLIKKNQG